MAFFASSTHPPRKYVSKLVPSSEIMLFICIVGTSLIDSVLTGFDSSLMGSLNVMPTYKSYFTLTTATLSLNTAISYVGGCVGALFAGYLTDKRGRRESILWSSVITFVGAIIQAAAVNIAMFIIGRFIIGIGMAVAATATPTYVAEVSKPSYRAFALGLYYSCWGVGTLIASGICYGTSTWTSTWAWRLPSLFQIVPSIFAFFIVMFIPESPRWLIARDRHEEALEVLAVVNAGGDTLDPRVQLQYREISDTIKWEKTIGGQLTMTQAWLKKSNRKRLMLAATYPVIVMLTGGNIITFYFGSMMSQAGITSPTTQLQINIILMAWVLSVSVLASWYADHVPRKVLCTVAVVGMAVSVYLLGVLTKLYGQSHNKSGVYGSIAMIFLAKTFVGLGINPLTVLYPAEILSFQIRSSGMAMYTFSTKSCGLLSTMAMPFALRNIGWKTYMIIGSYDVVIAALVIYYWVETRGLTLEEVDKKFDGVKHSTVPDFKDLVAGKVDLNIKDVSTDDGKTQTVITTAQREDEA